MKDPVLFRADIAPWLAVGIMSIALGVLILVQVGIDDDQGIASAVELGATVAATTDGTVPDRDINAGVNDATIPRRFGTSTAVVSVSSGGAGRSVNIARNWKENSEPVDAKEVLEPVVAMPISDGNLKNPDASNRYSGPVAQDFPTAFGHGDDHRKVNSFDAASVALAALQGLNQKLEEERRCREAENAALRSEIAELKLRLNRMLTKQ